MSLKGLLKEAETVFSSFSFFSAYGMGGSVCRFRKPNVSCMDC